MPPQLATIICVLFILYLFRADLKKKIDGVSIAIWVPFFWMFLAGSRFVSQWLNLGAPPMRSSDIYLEGSPLDRAVFLILIILGVLILKQRNLNCRMLLSKNIWICLFFLFGGVSILWSDYPLVSFKRWIKASGNVIMALVILTEQRPCEAVGVILRRLAFLLLPLSILFIKYYPDLGRTYHMGLPMFTGVASQKNGLGQICLISGVYFSWNLLLNRREGNKFGRQLHFSIYLIVLPMIAWLLYMSNSATSLVGMVVAICIFLVSRLPAVAWKPSRIMVLGLTVVSILGVLEATLGVSKLVIKILGRDPTLTTRVPMWYGLIAMAKNPFVGVGYESFWLGDRLDMLWRTYGELIQAHNGYLEIYLNLGLVGLALLVASMLSGLRKVGKQLNVDYPFAILRLVFIVIVAIYNWTEATFYSVSNMWLLLFLGILDTSGQQEADRIHLVEVDTQSVDSK